MTQTDWCEGWERDRPGAVITGKQFQSPHAGSPSVLLAILVTHGPTSDALLATGTDVRQEPSEASLCTRVADVIEVVV